MAESKEIMPVLTDEERFPAAENLNWLNALRQHPNSPLYNFKSGDRLTGKHLENLNAYRNYMDGRGDFATEDFIEGFYQDVLSDVPAYRDYPADFSRAPSFTREDLRRAPWNFVRDSAPLDDILCYATSGTTGAPLDVIFGPEEASSWLPQVEKMLSTEGISLARGPGTTAIALICSQLETLTYASVSSYLDGAGFIKINLHPGQWRDPHDCREYLTELNPSLLTGDPLAFAALMERGIPLRPHAMISSAMALSSGLADRLEAHFQCPLFDVYSMTECRNIAWTRKGMTQSMRPDLYLEVLDPEEDRSLPDGEWGELALSGGNNPYLPLIRYRTGDFCRFEREEDRLYLIDFQGRKPVRFSLPQGRWINTVDFSRALAPLALPAYKIVQRADYSLEVGLPVNTGKEEEVLTSLTNVLKRYGAENLPLKMGDNIGLDEDRKIITFQTEVPDSL